MSAASCDVSAMNPCELMLSAGAGSVQLERRPAVDLGERREALGHAADDRERHRQAERARPVPPTAGLPPTATHTGSGSWSGRG